MAVALIKWHLFEMPKFPENRYQFARRRGLVVVGAGGNVLVGRFQLARM